MVSVAPGGTADRTVARSLMKCLRADSGTSARYSSTSFGACLLFAAGPRLPDFAFFTRAMLQDPRSSSPYLAPQVRVPSLELSGVPASHIFSTIRCPNPLETGTIQFLTQHHILRYTYHDLQYDTRRENPFLREVEGSLRGLG